MTLTIRPAVPADTDLIYRFIRELADYEKLAHAVEADAADVAAVLFCQHPRAFCEIAEQDGAGVGFALWFYNLSTFTGRHGIYLEDLYLVPAARGAGVGRALMAALARRCLDEGLKRLEWAVLDWNTPAIEFYKAMGGEFLDEWRNVRVSGDALQRLAGTVLC